MTDVERRRFLQLSALTLSTSVLAGCGSGGGSDENSASSTDVPAPSSSPSPSPSGAVEALQFTVRANATLTSAPFALGYAFRAGDVPAGATLASDYGTLQVTPRNIWPDGSLKFAQLAGTVDLSANTETVIKLRKQSGSAGGTALSLGNLKATGVTAVTGCGSFGTATWEGADWDSPFQTWVSGPIMSSWIYRKPVGTDAHLVAWLEVRLFAGGAVEVLPWVENGYLMVAGPTNKSATYTFSLGGSQRFSAAINLPHHCRTPLVDGAKLSHWLASDPEVSIKHDVVYMQATELVPSYSAVVTSSSQLISAAQTTYVPLQQGGFTYSGDTMSAGGFAAPIGLLPQHDALYLVTDSMVTYGAVIRNGFSAGRYPIHYRDKGTMRPLKFSDYPTLVVSGGSGMTDAGASSTNSYTPTASGTNPPQWDGSHQPSVGYMAYLVTGRWYFMEQVQFAATANYLNITDVYRGGANGVATDYRLQTRNAAWSARTLAQALAATPDADTALRTEFISSVQATIDHFHSRYVAQSHNPFGLVFNGDYGGETFWRSSVWQNDFLTGAIGYMQALNLPISSSSANKLSLFFHWLAQSIVGRLGDSSNYGYINAAPYTFAYSPSKSPDFLGGTGPWYPNWAAVYEATSKIGSVAPYWGNTVGTLSAEILPGADSMWGNLQPAIAYAVRFGVSGASAAYARMTSASNWPALANQFNSVPGWSVRPVTVATPSPQRGPLPSWLNGVPLNRWVEIPNTVLAGSPGAPGETPNVYAESNFAVVAFSGAGFREDTSELWIACSGGHSDSSDNAVRSIALNANNPAWQLRSAATPRPSRTPDSAYYADGKPTSRHTYWSTHWSSTRRRLMLHRTRFSWPTAISFEVSNGFNPDNNTWDPPNSYYTPVQQASCRDSSDNVWAGNRTTLYKWTALTDRWAVVGQFGGGDFPLGPMAHDPHRNELFWLAIGDGQGYGSNLNSWAVGGDGQTRRQITFNPSAAFNQFMADQPPYAALEYDPDNRRYLFYAAQPGRTNHLYVVTPNSGSVWDMSMLTLDTAGVTPVDATTAGVLNRFRYVPALGGFVLMSNAINNLYFIRTA